MSKTQTLNQVVAVEKGVKSRIYGEVTDLHKLSQKADLYNGFNKTYEKIAEDGEDLPSEKKKVVLRAQDLILKTGSLLTELLDVTATKDYANCSAKADVIVDDVVLVKDAPVSFLLFLEKQLTDVRTFLDHLPVLDEAEDWTLDSNSGLSRTGEVKTHRTKKVQKALVLYPHSEKHPAQTQLVAEDIVAGYWVLTKQSGAITRATKDHHLAQTEKVLKAVKYAREQANSADAPKQEVGAQLFEFLFS